MSGGDDAGVGAVFRLTSDGAYSVLYSFTGGADGAYPAGDMLRNNGSLYNTANNGGDSGYGTVFEIAPDGTFTRLHSFAGAPSDGNDPSSLIMNSRGIFYGTTLFGGTHDLGMIFRLRK